jgi:hypothetical protein
MFSKTNYIFTIIGMIKNTYSSCLCTCTLKYNWLDKTTKAVFSCHVMQYIPHHYAVEWIHEPCRLYYTQLDCPCQSYQALALLCRKATLLLERHAYKRPVSDPIASRSVRGNHSTHPAPLVPMKGSTYMVLSRRCWPAVFALCETSFLASRRPDWDKENRSRKRTAVTNIRHARKM